MTNQSCERRSRLAMIVGGATLATLVALVVPAGVAQANRASTNPSALVVIARAPRVPTGDHVVGAVPLGAPEAGAVALRLPDPAAVTRFIAAASDPRSSSYHHFLARGQFAARFGPSPGEVAAVRHQLLADGLTVTGVAANHLFVTFSAPAHVAEAAFHTGLERVRLADGRIGQATTSAVQIPRAIASDVLAVIGLDRMTHETAGPLHARGSRPVPALRQPQGQLTGPGPTACSAAQATQATGGLTDQQVANSYGLGPLYTAGDTAASQTIDVYELEPFQLSDVQGFDECYFGADHTSQLSVIPVDGGAGTGLGSGEAALDVEDVSAIAPGATIHVFTGPNMDNPWGPLDTWNAIAVADDAGQVTSSWGLCETALQNGAPGVQQVENQIFEQTAAQGQTIFSSAGDDGSDDCAGHGSAPVAANLSLDDPSSQPYVTSVGGTTIDNPTAPPVETVWNNGNTGGAGGGGISETWAMPPWQTSMAVPQNGATEACSNDPSGNPDDSHLAGIPTTLPSGTPCRETPDVSALADPQTGITIEYAGQWFQIGGTSSSAPLWAAMLAEISGSAGCTGITHGVGFADPLLYQVAASSPANYAAAFNDITVGNNDALGVGGGQDWPAGTGYDLASGLGTPQVTDANGSPGLAAQLCTLAAGTEATAPPVVTSLSRTQGNVNGGGTLTINGTNFGSTTGSVYFGTAPATVTLWTSTAVTVDVPPYYEPENSQSPTAGSADVTVVTAGTPPESSAPGAASIYHYTINTAGRPVVDYVSTPTGPTGGGNVVDVVGAGLTGTTAVHFGDVLASGVVVLSDNELRVTVPPSDGNCAVDPGQGMCAVAVTVTNGVGTSFGGGISPAYQGPIVFNPDGSFSPQGCGCEVVQAPNEYDYTDPPTIVGSSPVYVSENGGSSLTVTGTNFNLLTFEWANVGAAGLNANEDFSIQGVSPTQLVVGIPPASALTTEAVVSPFSVQSSGGLSNISSFNYAGTPRLTSIAPHVAAQAAPGTLVVNGVGLEDVTSVVFQGQGPLSFLFSTSTALFNQTDTSLAVTIPPGFAIPTDVLLCSATGCTAPDPAIDTLTLAYPGRPVVNSSSPASGPAHGQTVVTIQGALDSEVTAVDFGLVPGTIMSQPEFTASGPITVIAPPGKAGTKVDVTITTVGGTLASPPAPRSAVNPLATFTYLPSTPSAPTHVVATAGVDSARVTWGTPASTGGPPVTGYVVVATAKGLKSVTVKVAASARLAQVASLKAGVKWTITVQATNHLGRGLPATAGPVVPRA